MKSSLFSSSLWTTSRWIPYWHSTYFWCWWLSPCWSLPSAVPYSNGRPLLAATTLTNGWPAPFRMMLSIQDLSSSKHKHKSIPIRSPWRRPAQKNKTKTLKAQHKTTSTCYFYSNLPRNSSWSTLVFFFSWAGSILPMLLVVDLAWFEYFFFFLIFWWKKKEMKKKKKGFLIAFCDYLWIWWWYYWCLRYGVPMYIDDGRE